MREGDLRKEVTARNALRLIAQLPLFDEQVEVARGLALEREQAHLDLLSEHSALLHEFKQEAIAAYERANGRRPTSVMRWWSIHLKGQERLEAELESRLCRYH